MATRKRIAVVCASNMNRSMEAHALLQKKHFDVCSYGTGANVKLPGKTATTPNVYEFETPYDKIMQELKQKDAEL
jgi:RNA polymerase II subunit A C-terminal domain phosphatase SSU72